VIDFIHMPVCSKYLHCIMQCYYNWHVIVAIYRPVRWLDTSSSSIKWHYQEKRQWEVLLTTITTTTLHSFNSFFSRTTWVSWYQKGNTSLDLNEARDDVVLGWQWHQLDHMHTIYTSLQTDNHTNTSSLNFYRPTALPDALPKLDCSYTIVGP